jgi:hypothetical protein
LSKIHPKEEKRSWSQGLLNFADENNIYYRSAELAKIFQFFYAKKYLGYNFKFRKSNVLL